MGPRSYNRPIDVLLVCTANQCRSPMAEVLLRHHLAEAGARAEVSSAGLLEGGRPATPHAVAAMADRHLDLSRHVSRQIDEPLVLAADLVVCMARMHVMEAVALAPGAHARTLTLKELVRAGEEIGPRRDAEPLGGWLAELAAARTEAPPLGVGHDDEFDVDDPIGRSRSAYDTTADLLDDLLGRLVALVWPLGAGCTA